MKKLILLSVFFLLISNYPTLAQTKIAVGPLIGYNNFQEPPYRDMTIKGLSLLVLRPKLVFNAEYQPFGSKNQYQWEQSGKSYERHSKRNFHRLITGIHYQLPKKGAQPILLAGLNLGVEWSRYRAKETENGKVHFTTNTLSENLLVLPNIAIISGWQSFKFFFQARLGASFALGSKFSLTNRNRILDIMVGCYLFPF